MRIDTFQQLKTPEVMASEIMAGEMGNRFAAAVVDPFGVFATGEVTMLKPMLSVERDDGTVGVRYQFVVEGKETQD